MRLAQEKAEQERSAFEKAEQERIVLKQAEQERLDREKTQQERLSREKAEKERLAQEEADQKRLDKEKAEKERLAQEKAEQERLTHEKSEQERLAFERAEQEKQMKEYLIKQHQMRDIYNQEINNQYYDPMRPMKRPGSPNSQHNQFFNQMQSYDQSNMLNLQQNHLQQKAHLETIQFSQYFDPHHHPQPMSLKRPESPNVSNLDQDQNGIPPIPSATPADKFGGETSGSVEKSHASDTSGIPMGLLDSVMEMAKIPVCESPANVKQSVQSPAKPIVQSPPKPVPVSEEQASKNELLKQPIYESKSSFEEPEKSPELMELEKEVMKIKPMIPDNDKDFKNTPENTKPVLESSLLEREKDNNSRKSDERFDKKSESDQKASDNLDTKSLSKDKGPHDPNPDFNIAGGLLSNVGNNTSMSVHSANGSDYDYDGATMGGVDYDDIDEELPFPARKSVPSKGSLKEIPDIGNWNKSEETPKSLNESKGSLTTSKADSCMDMPMRKEGKVPCYKTPKETGFDTSKPLVPFTSEKTNRVNAPGCGN